MRNVAVLVDGAFYLRQYHRHSSQSGAGYVLAIGAEQAAKDLVDHCLKHIRKQEERLYRIFFYDCPPLIGKVQNPITEKELDLSRTTVAVFRNDLHSQLRRTGNLALRLGALDEKNARWIIKDPEKTKAFISGQLKAITEWDIRYYAQQKGVDMKIGLDIASLAYKKLVNKIVLISGDSDFVPAAKLARKEGIEFILDPMGATIKLDLEEHIDGLETTLPKAKEPRD